MIDIDLVNVDFDISKDKEHTTKYLDNLNKQTPFMVLDKTYYEYLRAVLNYSPILKVREPFMGCKVPEKPIETPIETPKPIEVIPVDLSVNDSKGIGIEDHYVESAEVRYSFQNAEFWSLLTKHGFKTYVFQELVGEDWVDGVTPDNPDIPDRGYFQLRADGSIYGDVSVGTMYNGTIRAITRETVPFTVLGQGEIYFEVTGGWGYP